MGGGLKVELDVGPTEIVAGDPADAPEAVLERAAVHGQRPGRGALTQPKIQQRFEVQAIPALIALRRGQVAARRSGAAPAADLRAWVEAAIGP